MHGYVFGFDPTRCKTTQCNFTRADGIITILRCQIDFDGLMAHLAPPDENKSKLNDMRGGERHRLKSFGFFFHHFPIFLAFLQFRNVEHAIFMEKSLKI